MMPTTFLSAGCARRAATPIAAALALLTLASCANQDDIAAYPCPVVAPVRDVSYLTKFAGESEDLSDTLYEAKIDYVLPAANCIYQEGDGSRAIVYDIKVQFLAQRGPKEREGLAKFDYFIAITGPGGERVAREVFPTEISFEDNKTQNIVIEEVQPRIPLKEGENGDYYRIYVGFMMSEKELAYNRRNPR